MEAMALRSGGHLSGLPTPALQQQAEAVRVASRDSVASLGSLLAQLEAEHGAEGAATIANAVDWGGWTALHYAASGDKGEAVALLMARGVALRCDGDGWSPLHVGCLNGAAAAVAALLASAPAAAAQRTTDGAAPIELARAYGFDDVAALLSARGIPQPQPAVVVTEEHVAALVVGAAVTLNGAAEGIPKGTVGEIIAIEDDGRRVVRCVHKQPPTTARFAGTLLTEVACGCRFPAATGAVLPQQLLLAATADDGADAADVSSTSNLQHNLISGGIAERLLVVNRRKTAMIWAWIWTVWISATGLGATRCDRCRNLSTVQADTLLVSCVSACTAFSASALMMLSTPTAGESLDLVAPAVPVPSAVPLH